jgi:hypothetical protein
MIIYHEFMLLVRFLLCLPFLRYPKDYARRTHIKNTLETFSRPFTARNLISLLVAYTQC